MLPLPQPYLVNLPHREFVAPRNEHYGVVNPKSLGGVAISDTTEPLDKYLWEMYNIDKSVFIKRTNEPSIKLFETLYPIEWLDFCFDINMNPTVVYVENDKVFLRFFDTEIDDFSIIEVLDAHTPSISIDEYREFNINNATIVLAYMKGTNLVCRFQHERFGVEHTLKEFTKKYMLWRIGRTVDNRFGFYVR